MKKIKNIINPLLNYTKISIFYNRRGIIFHKYNENYKILYSAICELTTIKNNRYITVTLFNDTLYKADKLTLGQKFTKKNNVLTCGMNFGPFLIYLEKLIDLLRNED